MALTAMSWNLHVDRAVASCLILIFSTPSPTSSRKPNMLLKEK